MTRSSILSHPSRISIEHDILAGVPHREIAERYGLKSHTVVTRYAKEHMAKLIAKAELETVEGLLDRITRHIGTVESLIASIEDWLTGPDGMLDAAPRASEISVIYLAYTDAGPVKIKRTLAEIMQEVYSAREENDALPASDDSVLKVQLGIQDPRLTLLKAAETLNKQLELLAKAKGIVEEKVSVTVEAPERTIEELATALSEALAPYPEALRAVVDELAKITEAAV